MKVNKDPAFRSQFINNPAETLKTYGITLPDATMQELMSIVPVIKKHLPELANIPQGYEALLDEVGHGKQGGHTDDPTMLIL